MIKVSIISDEISQDLKSACELIKKYKLQGVELRSINEKNSFDFTKEDMQDIYNIVCDFGLDVPAISSPFFKCSLGNDEEYKEHIQGLENTIALANKLKTNIIRGFSFWNESTSSHSIEDIADKFEKPIKMLKDNGMILALESEPSVYTTNAKILGKLLKTINSPYVKALWDPGNEIYDIKDGETPFPDAYNNIKDEIVHVHIKDSVKSKDNSVYCCKIGEGQVDYIGQIKALIASGYNGYMSLETHYRKNASISEEKLKMPKGSVFSEGAFEATTESIESLLEILKKLV